MTPEQFAYWLQGFNEICGGRSPTEEQWKIIQDHLHLVFKKETPYYNITNSHMLPMSSNIFPLDQRSITHTC